MNNYLQIILYFCNFLIMSYRDMLLFTLWEHEPFLFDIPVDVVEGEEHNWIP